jgi:hypothetical protein
MLVKPWREALRMKTVDTGLRGVDDQPMRQHEVCNGMNTSVDQEPYAMVTVDGDGLIVSAEGDLANVLDKIVRAKQSLAVSVKERRVRA